MKHNPIWISLAAACVAFPCQAQNIAAIDPAICEKAPDVCIDIVVPEGGELLPIFDVPVVDIGAELEGIDPRIFQAGPGVEVPPTSEVGGELEGIDPRIFWSAAGGGGVSAEAFRGQATPEAKLANTLIEAKLEPAKQKAARPTTKAKKAKPLAAAARGKTKAQGFVMLKTASAKKAPAKVRQGKRVFLK